MVENDDDEMSITSASPMEQCIFWTLCGSFMVKLVCFVVVAVIIHDNAWILVEPNGLDYTFERGISFDDCAREVIKPEHVECIKWANANDTEWFQFWRKHGVIAENVKPPGAWYSNAYYICLLLLIWYVIDMISILVMCCRQKQTSDSVVYQKQISLLCAVFIVITYISVHAGLAHSRQEDFVKTQFEATSSLGLGAKLFAGTFGGYLLGCLIQHGYHFYNCRECLTRTQRFFKNMTWQRFLGLAQRQETTINRNEERREFELQRLRTV